MKKVIQIGGNLGINGISSYIMEHYRKMNDKYQFIFINTADDENGYYKDEIEKLGGKVYHIHSKKRGPFRSLDQAKKIREIIKKEKPDAVHSHYFSNNGIYLKQAFNERVKSKISHCHNAKVNLTLFKKLALKQSYHNIMKYSDYQFACSDRARSFLYKDKGITLFNSIDFSKHYKIDNLDEIYAKYDLDKNNRYVCFVGRFSNQKNPQFLFEILKEAKKEKDIKFIFITYGKQLDLFKQKIDEEKLDNIIFLPKDTNVNEIMNISQCLILPSIYEGFPIVALEAQACGLPCLISKTVTREIDLGLCTFLEFSPSTWLENIKNAKPTLPIYNPIIDINYSSIILGYLYDGYTSDDFIQIAKEYTLGSKRVYRNKELAYLCFKMASDLGNIRGTFYYGLSYYEGNGVKKDKDKANQILNPVKQRIIDKAIEELNNKTPNPVHLTIYADMFSFGYGLENNFEKAFELYYKASECGNLEAMCDLGYMYLVGQGVEKDEVKSSYYYKLSADKGYVHSMRDIGQNYMEALGVEKNIEEAKRYFKLASINNYSHGTSDLAKCLIEENADENEICNLLNLALKQDYERTFRDLVEMGYDIKELKENSRLIKTNITKIEEINEFNSYNGVLYVSSRIEYIDPNCFYKHKEIFKIFVEKGNKNYCSIGGVLYSKDKSTVVRYPIGLIDSQYNVIDGVKIIGPHAFQNARNLKSIALPNSVTTICDSSFDDCKLMEYIDLPSNIKKIGPWAFHGCDNLKNIVIPKSVEEIGTYAFGSCEALEDIVVFEGNNNYVSLNGSLYTKDMKELLQYPIGSKNEEFIVPGSVKALKFRCLSDSYNLKKVIANNVEVIEEKVFYYCTNLKEIYLNSNVKLNGQKIFDNTSKDLVIVKED